MLHTFPFAWYLSCCSTDTEGSISCAIVACLFSHTHCIESMKSAGMGSAAQLQAASHGPAGSYSQGCIYYTLFYRKHCFAGNIFHFQQSGSSGSMRCNIFQRKLFSFLSSVLILANKASELVPQWSLQAERRGTAFTMWNWSILSVLVSKRIKEKKKKIKKV